MPRKGTMAGHWKWRNRWRQRGKQQFSNFTMQENLGSSFKMAASWILLPKVLILWGNVEKLQFSAVQVTDPDDAFWSHFEKHLVLSKVPVTVLSSLLAHLIQIFPIIIFTHLFLALKWIDVSYVSFKRMLSFKKIFKHLEDMMCWCLRLFLAPLHPLLPCPVLEEQAPWNPDVGCPPGNSDAIDRIASVTFVPESPFLSSYSLFPEYLLWPLWSMWKSLCK